MKKSILVVLFTAALCLAMLAGCGDNSSLPGAPVADSGNSQSQTLDAPIPNHTAGSYTGALRLYFDGEALDGGKLFVLIDRYETPEDIYWLQYEENNRAEGLVIFNYPDEHDFYVDIFTPGSHFVRAFSMDDNGEYSEVYEGTYEIGGADFSGFDFSDTVDENASPLNLSFDGTDGATVYYTLDGSDPLIISVAGANLSRGTQLSEGTLVLLPGTYTVTARCITDDGLVSPMIQETFHVQLNFDSASMQIEEDGSYEYYCDGKGALMRYNKATGKFENIFNQRVTHLAVFTIVVQGESGNGLLPESEVRADEKQITKTYIYARVSNGRVYRTSSIDGVVEPWEEVSGADTICRVGLGWYRTTEDDPYFGYRNHAFWNHVEQQQSTEEVAEKADVLLNSTAIYCTSQYCYETENRGYRVYACDDFGNNERILWSNETVRPIIDAISGDNLLYHYRGENGDVHMVYNMKTGEHYANPFVKVGDVVAGYTSSAVYVNGGRVEIDYSKLK